MALSHILAAITAEADAQIADASAKHDAAVRSMNEGHAAAMRDVAASIKQKKQERMNQLRRRAEDHTEMLRRHAVLERKQSILDDFYDNVIRELAALPANKTEQLLSGWVKHLPKGGRILPSKIHEGVLKKIGGGHEFGPSIAAKGGFRFEGEREDRDYTYEFLVAEILRPATEISVANQIFSAA